MHNNTFKKSKKYFTSTSVSGRAWLWALLLCSGLWACKDKIDYPVSYHLQPIELGAFRYYVRNADKSLKQIGDVKGFTDEWSQEGEESIQRGYEWITQIDLLSDSEAYVVIHNSIKPDQKPDVVFLKYEITSDNRLVLTSPDGDTSVVQKGGLPFYYDKSNDEVLAYAALWKYRFYDEFSKKRVFELSGEDPHSIPAPDFDLFQKDIFKGFSFPYFKPGDTMAIAPIKISYKPQ